MNEWRSQALCLGLEPQNVAPEHCVECPVKHQCLWAALSWADWYRTDSYLACLVWGGFYGATRNKAMHAAGFREKVAYQALLEKEKAEMTTVLSDESANNEDLMKAGERLSKVVADLGDKEMHWLELSEYE